MASNAFYQASGNPATGAAGLSALVRAEFLSIQTAFDIVASFQTTGLYVSTFVQQGSYTFTLPNRAGVLALTADVATAVAAEAARATGAEGALNGSIIAEANTRGAGDTSLVGQIASEANTRLAADALLAPKANPVITGSLTINDASAGNTSPFTISSPGNAAGAGFRLLGNGAVTPSKYFRAVNGVFDIVNSGYTASILSLSDAGNLSVAGTFVAAGGIPALTAETNRATAAEATKQANLGFVPVATGWGANVVSIGWNAGHLDAQVDATYLGAIVTTLAPQGFALVSAVASEANTRLAQDQLLAPKANPVITDTLTINDTSAGNNAPFTISSPNNAAGAGFRLLGNGSVTPSKYFRVVNGSFNIVNSAYTAAILTLDDAGNLAIGGTFGAVGGIPALTAETNRATLAETTERNRAIAAEGTKQANLGFVPVTQGWNGNTVQIGWDGTKMNVQVDATYLGAMVTTLAPQGFALTTAVTAETNRATAAEATKQANLGYVPVRTGFGTNVIYLGWNAGTLAAQVDTTYLGQVPTQISPGNFIRNGDNATLGTLNLSSNLLGALGVYASTTATGNGLYLVGDSSTRRLNWTSDGWKLNFDVASGTLAQFNNVGGAVLTLSTNGNLTVPGTMSASNVSDERTKRAITPYRSGLAAVIGLEPVSYQYNGTGGTTDTGKTRWGVTAQQARQFLPEGVSETPEPDADPTLDQAPVKVRLPGQLSFDEQPLLYAMINAFRDVAAELVSVKARLATLEGG